MQHTLINEEPDDFVLDLHVISSIIPKQTEESLFKIILISSGSGIAILSGVRHPFMSPCALLLNEKEAIVFEKISGKLKTCSLTFHPKIINSLFEYDFIRNAGRTELKNAIVQDLFWLNMFLHRDETYWGHLLLNPIMMRKSLAIKNAIEKRLSDKEDLFWICRSRSYFIELLLFLSQLFHDRAPQTAVTLEHATQLVEDIIVYLHANYGKKITLDIISKEFGVNRTTANELFQDKTGDPIITYLIKLRMNVASILLRDTNIPIKEISDRVGYNNLNNFCRAFKQKIGYPPAQYRENFKVSFC